MKFIKRKIIEFREQEGKIYIQELFKKSSRQINSQIRIFNYKIEKNMRKKTVRETEGIMK